MNIKVDAIELVGGGSRIPKFVELVEQVFETTASRTINSSETIATGATLAAVKESGLFRFNTLNVINRSASSLALSWK
jgi:molecular chaperone DnaK (HSP70)